MVFDCPWGCGERTGTERGISGGPFHENVWECPEFSSKLLRALEAIGQTQGARRTAPRGGARPK